ncbi:hypothetical protein PVK06_020973 [Gossypium arboreum]|uniref:Uncharacterized protein n=1 Tax=Gossypium arboreum TaxID=29729 RepID=A0ABR0PPF6_GOSAR|nr:hypothetical protein PVK06_020973 [Gossypium arboreum]
MLTISVDAFWLLLRVPKEHQFRSRVGQKELHIRSDQRPEMMRDLPNLRKLDELMKKNRLDIWGFEWMDDRPGGFDLGEIGKMVGLVGWGRWALGREWGKVKGFEFGEYKFKI